MHHILEFYGQDPKDFEKHKPQLVRKASKHALQTEIELPKTGKSSTKECEYGNEDDTFSLSDHEFF